MSTGKSSTFANQLLLHIFQNAAISLIGDATGLPAAGTVGSLYMSLHTADPSAGDQTTNEVAYTPYARQPVARTSGGFTVSASAVSNTAQVNFPPATAGGPTTATHAGIGTSVSGAGKLLYVITLSPQIVGIQNGVTPYLPAGTGAAGTET
jgi:hypothetical protein